MASKGSRRVLKNGLTQKENALKNKVLEQIANGEEINQTEAAMQVYGVKDRSVARSVASEVLAKPDIKQQIEAALEEQGLTPSKILSNIGKLASSEPVKVTADVVLRSNQDLMRLWGGYPDKKTAHVNFNVSGRIKSMTFEEAKQTFDRMNAEVGELVGDAE